MSDTVESVLAEMRAQDPDLVSGDKLRRWAKVLYCDGTWQYSWHWPMDYDDLAATIAVEAKEQAARQLEEARELQLRGRATAMLADLADAVSHEEGS